MKPLLLILAAVGLVAMPVSSQAQDLSTLSFKDLVIAAQIDAKEYFASHRPIVRDYPGDNDYTAHIGIARAISHNLLGTNVDVYAATFFQTLDSLIQENGGIQ